MGCDIHLHIELKIDGEWHHYSAPSVDRSYPLFQLMADVRGAWEELKPVSKPKGLPNDITKITELCSRRDNYHDHSWLSAEEITILYERWQAWQISEGRKQWDNDLDLPGKFSYFEGNSWIHFRPGENLKGVEDIRFVFWFDN